ncbi:class I SAM-dependent methyltransferase [Sphingobacterium deserti]|uniref:Methyltransferase type 11 domain-containing protein n=1 Tax=Sphingobacterium deserti TaxID=1229276 RepID=A0A0B8T4D0_9SPHI|nr:methyltransferase domain-containing protein [Sphingobacterium deserti]KGE14463.1 hypothetical protein DI53_1492 [Sphingobacterium deserti]
MEIKRQTGQGLIAIIRFNWPFYAVACVSLLAAVILLFYSSFPYPILLTIFILILSYALSASLLISFYIYDLSELYQLRWLHDKGQQRVLTVNAGFDETSNMIRRKLPNTKLVICDFYNPKKHTEPSIRRARNAFPPDPESLSIETQSLPFGSESFDEAYAILSAHEVRNEAERIRFFQELNRVTKTSGKIYINEHLCDWKNFLAYTIGVFHFHSRQTWLRTFSEAGLHVEAEIKVTPFLTTFVVRGDGNTH